MRTATTIKKHLSFDSLRESFSKHLLSIPDHRQSASCTHSLHDAMMSAFACMFFQDASLSEFQRRMQEMENRNNLSTLFDVQTIPKDTQLRDIVDQINSHFLRPVFNDYFEKLRRGKHLEPYQILPGQYLCAIDGVYHHSSDNIHCDQCLTRTHKDGSITYHHGVLQGAFMHPDKKQIVPVMPEPIANGDGQKKQDCEINAAKRFIRKLKADHPRLGMIITGDGLFSKGPMIRQVLDEKMHFLFVAKPADHKYMMDWIAGFDSLSQVVSTDLKGRGHKYTFVNQVPLNAKEDAPLVNYIHYELSNESGKVTYRNSWVTDIKVSEANVVRLAKGGRCRWKIENECFNTLKNQGYCLAHNFGHGKRHLSHNMYLLTLLAFFYHQIFELSDPAYQLCRRSLVSKKDLWGRLRVLIQYFIFDSWNDLMLKLMVNRGGIPFLSKN
ncbi:hypothetical protein MNBD_IGNAVI01-3169 [hydrothermal vent metagenome]|uniref:Transposase IS4-like domain-containing protein n=1 Tax=hydrothermal vent metagenome TaxID=652676 RepID=A0A3B1BZ93_9ZZZZ